MVERRVLPSLTEEEREHLLAQAHLHTLVEMLEAIPDPRGKHGLRYDLPYLLTCLIAALLCNCQSTEAVSQWCREHLNLLQDLFGPRLFFTPNGSLYRWLLPQINAEAVERVLRALGQGHQPGLTQRSPRRRWQNGARSQDGRARCAPSAFLLSPSQQRSLGRGCCGRKNQ
jgi:hypothetical protein